MKEFITKNNYFRCFGIYRQYIQNLLIVGSVKEQAMKKSLGVPRFKLK